MNINVTANDLIMLLQGRTNQLANAFAQGQIDTAIFKAHIAGMFTLADQLHEMAEAEKAANGVTHATGGSGGEARAN
jgi:hypothetical protein